MNIKYLIFFLFIILLTSCSTSKPIVDNEKITSRITDAEQRQFDYYFYEGIRLKENKQYDEALETFILCMNIDSLDAGVQSEAGMLYASIGLVDKAVQYMENAVRLDARNWWYNVRLVSLLSETKNWKRAVVVANSLQKKYPNKEEVYNMQASLYKQTKEFDKAIEAYDRLENLMGIDEALSFEKFRLYLQQNKAKKGVAEIDKLINKFPTETRYKVLRGDIFMQQNMPEKAFEIYQQVLKDDPKNAFVYVSLSEYYNTVNQPEKAVESIVSALKTEQLDVDTKVEILGQYVEKLVQDSTKFAETESLFKLLVDRYPLEEQVHGYYAVFLQFRKRNVEAGAEFESMININPKNEQTWLRLLQLYLAERNYAQLMNVTGRAIENLPKISTWYFYRGIAQYQLADYEGALETYQTALPLITPEQAALRSDFHAQIGDIYYKLSKKTEAFAAYEEALTANPRNVMVMNNYAYYLSLEKLELKKAERMSAKTVELEPKNSTYLDTYAWILYQQGNYTLAKFYIERAVDNLEKDYEPGVILEHYGDILWMTKEDEKALQMWQKSLEAGNDTEELKQKIENKGWKRE
jgi:tetratricopeptide (TPR) repeat protein